MSDRAFDIADVSMDPRDLNATPHVARYANRRRSAIDGQTTRYKGYAASRRLQKRIKAFFCCAKPAASLGNTRLGGLTVAVSPSSLAWPPTTCLDCSRSSRHGQRRDDADDFLARWVRRETSVRANIPHQHAFSVRG
jgi:hypothetical protein